MPQALPDTQAILLHIGGRVQGVGFRPFVYRLAHELGIAGWVRNCSGHVEVLAEGPAAMLERFTHEVIGRAPPLARPQLIRVEDSATQRHDGFLIRHSEGARSPRASVPPDYFACDDCLAEMRDPRARRYRYPFINCTQCGPRYTLIRRLPYDRPHTAMDGFVLCAACRTEYEDPSDRRFHAQPLACPECGPLLRFGAGDTHETGERALRAAVQALRDGNIVAVKGVGGYHLLCDARSESAVARLRARKPRPHKPLAVMFAQQGHDGLGMVRSHLAPDADESMLLVSPERPIVLIAKGEHCELAAGIAPRLREVGAMLPYSPLHHLLLDDFNGPLVATSGNVGGEPVLTENDESSARLAAIADAFLHHDRPILRPADDSVFRVMQGRARPLRLGRGIAPMELALTCAVAEPVLAVGGHTKNTVALAVEDRVILSPHIGDLDAPRARDVFERVAADLQAFYGVRAQRLVCDAHPGYASARWARAQGIPVTPVFHHRAHASALYGEHKGAGEWLVFTWDGVGLGEDGTLWGGETLLGSPGHWQRVAHLRPFRLPGGERAGREPWRSAAALGWSVGREDLPLPEDAALLRLAWQRGLNSPFTSAAGRVFDAAASLAGLIHVASFEGQGPMQLEAIASASTNYVRLPLEDSNGVLVTDWAPLVALMLDTDLPVGERAARFHRSLAHAVLAQAERARALFGVSIVGLTGGVFQNRLLTEAATMLLADAGFCCMASERVPCNDGGLSYGQIVEALAAQ